MKRALTMAVLTLLCAPAQAAPRDGVAAVLSKNVGFYLEAFSAFQAGYGAEVRRFDASKGAPALPPGADIVVAFGARAASQDYPPQADLVYCMSPGHFVSAAGRTGKTVKISMRPSNARLLGKLKQIQPSLKRLTVFWAGTGYSDQMQELRSAGPDHGIEVSLEPVRSAAELPALLRKGLQDMDAFWLPPDPLLISPDTLMIFREFSQGNAIPMYASTRGLAQEGATASVGVSFKTGGAAAAQAVKGLERGEDIPELVFPDALELTLNASAARRCGITFPPEILREAAYLFP
ncbi:MAG: hypothetical protein A2X29_07140 [Elusimicrobia bacterium GWA2_64_40]|nr:MAG: hypothetical protein A2X29_07140 [Elusimicrobia bacterium GWA2_64_40]OGR64636.1 MAG: hypothetical protein A2X30_04300 [Elusimicrobia bacterium GWB2_63_16]